MRGFPLVLVLVLAANSATAQWQRTREQIPGLNDLPDRTAELQKLLNDGRGRVLLTDQVYRITRTIDVDLAELGATSIRAAGGVTIVMDGPGPAFRLTGTHTGTASPRSFKPGTWNERMPVLSGFEILGSHPEASGIELHQTVGAVIEQVSVRWCMHGVHLVERNRNVIVSNSHLYENSGVGLYLDDVNLHQINVSNSHISYNRGGGIVVRDGNVRNLQVTGCDIEGNMPADETPTSTANILIDVSGSDGDRSRSVAEIAITGCTIQHSANYSGVEEKTVAPGGANIRLAGKEIYPINSVAITGNVLSDTTTGIDISYTHDVTISGNTFFAPQPANLVVENSQRIVVTGNTFNPRQFVRPGTIRFTNCQDCVLASSTLYQFDAPGGAVLLDHCSGFVVSGLVLTKCRSGIVLQDTSSTTIAACRISQTAVGGADIAIDSSNEQILLTGNAFSGEQRIASQTVMAP